MSHLVQKVVDSGMFPGTLSSYEVSSFPQLLLLPRLDCPDIKIPLLLLLPSPRQHLRRHLSAQLELVDLLRLHLRRLERHDQLSLAHLLRFRDSLRAHRRSACLLERRGAAQDACDASPPLPRVRGAAAAPGESSGATPSECLYTASGPEQSSGPDEDSAEASLQLERAEAAWKKGIGVHERGAESAVGEGQGDTSGDRSEANSASRSLPLLPGASLQASDDSRERTEEGFGGLSKNADAQPPCSGKTEAHVADLQRRLTQTRSLLTLLQDQFHLQQQCLERELRRPDQTDACSLACSEVCLCGCCLLPDKSTGEPRRAADRCHQREEIRDTRRALESGDRNSRPHGPRTLEHATPRSQISSSGSHSSSSVPSSYSSASSFSSSSSSSCPSSSSSSCSSSSSPLPSSSSFASSLPSSSLSSVPSCFASSASPDACSRFGVESVSALFSGPTAAAVAAPFLVIYAHGNGSDIGDVHARSALLAERLQASFLLFDYPGYGKYAGAADEASVDATLRSVLAFAIHCLGWPPQKIVLWGTSIGTGPCTRAACSLAHAARQLRPRPGPTLDIPNAKSSEKQDRRREARKEPNGGERGEQGEQREARERNDEREGKMLGFGGSLRRSKKRADAFCVGEAPSSREEREEATENRQKEGRRKGTNFSSFIAGVAAAVAGERGAGLATKLGTWIERDNPEDSEGEGEETNDSCHSGAPNTFGDFNSEETLASASLMSSSRCSASSLPSHSSLTSSSSSSPASFSPLPSTHGAYPFGGGSSSDIQAVSSGSQAAASASSFSLPVTSRLASLPVPAGLVLQCPYRSITHAAAAFVPSLVARALVSSGWNVENEVLSCDCPVLWIHGQADELFPWEGSLAMLDAYRQVCELRRSRAAATAALGAQLAADSHATEPATEPLASGDAAAFGRLDREETDPKVETALVAAQSAFMRRDVEEWAIGHFPEDATHGEFDFRKDLVEPVQRLMKRSQQRCVEAFAGEIVSLWTSCMQPSLPASSAGVVFEAFRAFFASPAPHGPLDGVSSPHESPAGGLASRDSRGFAPRLRFLLPPHVLCGLTLSHPLVQPLRPTVGDYFALRTLNSSRPGTKDASLRGWLRGDVSLFGLGGVSHLWSAKADASGNEETLSSASMDSGVVSEDEEDWHGGEETEGETAASEGIRLASVPCSSEGVARGPPAFVEDSEGGSWRKGRAEREGHSVAETSSLRSMSAPSATDAALSSSDAPASLHSRLDEKPPHARAVSQSASVSSRSASISSRSSVSSWSSVSSRSAGSSRSSVSSPASVSVSTAPRFLRPRPRWGAVARALAARAERAKKARRHRGRKRALSAFSPDLSLAPWISLPPLQETLLQNFCSLPALLAWVAHRYSLFLSRLLQVARERFAADRSGVLGESNCFLAEVEFFVRRLYVLLQPSLFVDAVYKRTRKGLQRNKERQGEVRSERDANRGQDREGACDGQDRDGQGGDARMQGDTRQGTEAGGECDEDICYTLDSLVIAGVRIRLSTPSESTREDLHRLQSPHSASASLPGMLSVEYLPLRRPPGVAGAVSDFQSRRGARHRERRGVAWPSNLKAPPVRERDSGGFGREDTDKRASRSGHATARRPRPQARRRQKYFARPRLSPLHLLFPAPKFLIFPVFVPPLPSLSLTVQWLMDALALLFEKGREGAGGDSSLRASPLTSASPNRPVSPRVALTPSCDSDPSTLLQAPLFSRVRGKLKLGSRSEGAWRVREKNTEECVGRSSGAPQSGHGIPPLVQEELLKGKKTQISILFADQLLKQLLSSPLRPAFEALGAQPVLGRLSPRLSSGSSSGSVAEEPADQSRGFPVVVGSGSDFIAGGNFFPFGWDVLFLLLFRCHIPSYLPRLVPPLFLSPPPCAGNSRVNGVTSQSSSSSCPQSSSPSSSFSSFSPCSFLSSLSVSCVGSQSRWGEDPGTVFWGAQLAEQLAQRRGPSPAPFSKPFPWISPEAVKQMTVAAARMRAASLASSLAFCLPLSLGWASSPQGSVAERQEPVRPVPLSQNARDFPRVFHWEQLSPAHSLLVQTSQVAAVASALDLSHAAHADFLLWSARASGQLGGEEAGEKKDGMQERHKTRETSRGIGGDTRETGPVQGGWRGDRRREASPLSVGLPPSLIRGVFLASEEVRSREEKRLEQATAQEEKKTPREEKGSALSFFSFAAKRRRERKGARADVQDIACPVRDEARGREERGEARGERGGEEAREAAREPVKEPQKESEMEKRLLAFFRDSFVFSQPKFFLSERARDAGHTSYLHLPDRLLAALCVALRRYDPEQREGSEPEADRRGEAFFSESRSGESCRRDDLEHRRETDGSQNPKDAKIRIDDVATPFLRACREADPSEQSRRQGVPAPGTVEWSGNTETEAKVATPSGSSSFFASSAPQTSSSSSSIAPPRAKRGGETGEVPREEAKETDRGWGAPADRGNDRTLPPFSRPLSSCSPTGSASRGKNVAPAALFLSGAGDCHRLDTERDAGDGTVFREKEKERQEEKREKEREERGFYGDDGNLAVCEAPLRRPSPDSWDVAFFRVSSPVGGPRPAVFAVSPPETPTVQDEQRELAEWCFLAALIRAELATVSLLRRAPTAGRDRQVKQGDREETAEQGNALSGALRSTGRACESAEEKRGSRAATQHVEKKDDEEELLRLALRASSVHGLAAAASPSLPFHPLTVALERLLLYVLDQVYRFDSAPSSRRLPRLSLAPFSAPLAPFLPAPLPMKSRSSGSCSSQVSRDSDRGTPQSVPSPRPERSGSSSLPPGGPPSLVPSRPEVPVSHFAFPARVSSAGSSSLGSADQRSSVGRLGTHAVFSGPAPVGAKRRGAGETAAETLGVPEPCEAQRSRAGPTTLVFKNSAGAIAFLRARSMANSDGLNDTKQVTEGSRDAEARRFSSVPSDSCGRARTAETKEKRRPTLPPIEIRNELLPGPRSVDRVSLETQQDVQQGRGGPPSLPLEGEELHCLGRGVSAASAAGALQQLHALAPQSRLLPSVQELKNQRITETPAPRISVLKTPTPTRTPTLPVAEGKQQDERVTPAGPPAGICLQGFSDRRQTGTTASPPTTEGFSFPVPGQTTQEVEGPMWLSSDGCTNIFPWGGCLSVACAGVSAPAQRDLQASWAPEGQPERVPGPETEAEGRLPGDKASCPPNGPAVSESVFLKRSLHMRECSGTGPYGDSTPVWVAQPLRPMRLLPSHPPVPLPVARESSEPKGDTRGSHSGGSRFEDVARNSDGKDSTENKFHARESFLSGSSRSLNPVHLQGVPASLAPTGAPQVAGVSLRPLSSAVLQPLPLSVFPQHDKHGRRLVESLQKDGQRRGLSETREFPGPQKLDEFLRDSTESASGATLSLAANGERDAVNATSHQQARDCLGTHMTLGQVPHKVEQLDFFRRGEFVVDKEEARSGEIRKLGQFGCVQNAGGKERTDTSSSRESEGADPIFAVDNLLSG
ncbi:alpha/beta hydrolase family protein [Toxoplasma gondii ARI]|uniref:Alpha/beta hydrolase family protein n=1 Tax=Toxoplasma gondii ARI TaxID=1074872 RepID=A0A139Y1E0_TOXGO|nr:alpha/beta hydrolase family protein [Toxoplasma gondii ARI]